MGTCTSTVRHRQKQQHHNRISSKNPIVLDIKQPPPLPPPFPLTILTNHHTSFCSDNEFNYQSSPVNPAIYHSNNNSLIQLYSNPIQYICTSPSQNHYMSSISSTPTHPPPRIPVPKNRFPVYHSSATKNTVNNTESSACRQVPLTMIPNNPNNLIRPMSINNRPQSSTATQNRFGFIPRPTVPGAQGTTLVNRSRSISPTSTISAQSSTSSSVASQRVMKLQAVSKAPTNPMTTASPTHPTFKATISPRQRDSSLSKSQPKTNFQTPTSTSRLRSRTPSRTSAASLSSCSSVASPSASSVSPPVQSTTTSIKTDVNAIRDRYRNQQRMNFFTRHTPISTANGSPMMADVKSPGVENVSKEKQTHTPTKSPRAKVQIQQHSHDLRTITPSKNVLSTVEASNMVPTSSHLSQNYRHRQRAISMLSAGSGVSDVLNQEALLEDDNCSLKSDDLMCDYDDTLTMDSTTKTDQTDTSSVSLSFDMNPKTTSTITIIPTTATISSTGKDNRPAVNAKAQTTSGYLRESLDELNRLSGRVDNTIESEVNRKVTGARSVSMKPPSNYLPPLEDAEQITMDVESYRQVMKDVMVVKTILHQLDRLLKSSDGSTMTDSMVGSVHEYHDPMIASRRFSSSTDGSVRTITDENLSYEDLLKEIVLLRKEKEQDKQTIRLLQEQMYKYSSHVNS